MLTIVNSEQSAAWNGDEGEHWTEHADRYDVAGGRLWSRFLAAGLIGASDRVLDIGCGTGQSTRDAARAAASGSALGVDLSGIMLERARHRAVSEGLTNVTFEQADAQVHPFDEGAFDVAISRFGAMFFADPVAAFANIRRAVRSEGRLALLAWRGLAENDWLQLFRGALAQGRDLPEPPPDAPTPFSLADPDRVRRVFTEAGFADVEFEAIDEPMKFGSDADDAFGFIRSQGVVKGLTDDLDDAAKAQAFEDLRAVVKSHETGDGVLLDTAAWLITAKARRARP